MRLILKNIGIIEEADININGLTVIAGDNDTGKSTVGKIAYSLTKSFEDFESNYKNSINKNIRKYSRDIFRLIREGISISNHEDMKKLRNIGGYLDSYNTPLFIEKKEEIKKTIKEMALDAKIREGVKKTL